MKVHTWKLIQTCQWSDGNGHLATEVCSGCGRIALTSVGYRGQEPAKRGNYNLDIMPDEHDIDAEECPATL